jgi:AraC-like DNA-binding protein
MPVWTGAKLKYPAGRERAGHAHDEMQTFYVRSGLLGIRTAGGAWVIPPGRLGCIKPGVVHAATILSDLEAWSVFCPLPRALVLKEDICILQCSALLGMLLERVAECEKLNLKAPVDRGLAALAISEMSKARSESLGIPLPSSKSLVKVARQILENGSEGKSISVWAKAAGMSVRSFSRNYRAETGQTFEQWRTRANHQKAIELLSQGENVTSCAFALGYESVSAFIASFRKHHGITPSKFLRRGL